METEKIKWINAEYSSDNGRTWYKYTTSMIEDTLQESIVRIKCENKRFLFRNFSIEESYIENGETERIK